LNTTETFSSFPKRAAFAGDGKENFIIRDIGLKVDKPRPFHREERVIVDQGLELQKKARALRNCIASGAFDPVKRLIDVLLEL
jgi:hypothetical protein